MRGGAATADTRYIAGRSLQNDALRADGVGGGRTADAPGSHAADALGADHDCVYKTLVLKGEKTGYLVCCIPVDEELDLKKTARAAGDKKVEMIHVKELLPLTGYIRGGCSPIGMKKKFPTYIEETAQLYDRIYVSAGMRGCQVILAPEDLRQMTEGVFAALI